MILNTTYVSRQDGKIGDLRYEEFDDFETLRHLPVGAIGAFCFYNNKLVLVYANKRKSWEVPGGGHEQGESFEECITREIKEESNMKVLELLPLGCETYSNRETKEDWRILRYAARVEPYGDFTSDGAEDGEITEIKLIDPADYKQYQDWGERGDMMMKKALQIVR